MNSKGLPLRRAWEFAFEIDCRCLPALKNILARTCSQVVYYDAFGFARRREDESLQGRGSRFPVGRQTDGFVATGSCGVVDAPMERVVRAGQFRAALAGGVGERDDVVELLLDEFVDRLRAGGAPVDAEFGEHSDGELAYTAGGDAGGARRERWATVALEEGFGELASP